MFRCLTNFIEFGVTITNRFSMQKRGDARLPCEKIGRQSRSSRWCRGGVAVLGWWRGRLEVLKWSQKRMARRRQRSSLETVAPCEIPHQHWQTVSILRVATGSCIINEFRLAALLEDVWKIPPQGLGKSQLTTSRYSIDYIHWRSGQHTGSQPTP
jgi:hypothetical protein